MRLAWLASELRAAGCAVVEVDGWQSRGSDEFTPEGVTWHATAGSRKATAVGEVGVILHGSTTAPPPIAQLMIWRDGTVWVCAAGRCNHNKVGWAGPNRGLGNTRLLGIEMANDNQGEPWPVAQLDAARRATAAIMRRLGADPLKRLAGHYEHQPSAGRPAGETSIKTDPYGVDMTAERARVAALMRGDDDMPSAEDIARAVWSYDVDPSAVQQSGFGAILTLLARTGATTNKQLPAIGAGLTALAGQVQAFTGRDLVDETAIVAGILAGLDPERLGAAITAAGITPQALAAALPAEVAAEVVDEIQRRLTGQSG